MDDVISDYQPVTPYINGLTHPSTRSAPRPNYQVPLTFVYDPLAFQALGQIALQIHAGTYCPGQPDAIHRQIGAEKLNRRYARPTPVTGEPGVQSAVLNQLAQPMIDQQTSEREWQPLLPPFDLGLREGLDCLAHVEVKCGANAIPTADENPRIVLSPGFLDAMVDYLKRHRSIQYAEATHGLEAFPRSVQLDDGAWGFHAFPDTSDEENIRRLLPQIRAQFCQIQTETPNRFNRYILLSTFRQALLFTLHPDRIALSDPLSINSVCTADRPIGNVAAIFMVLGNLRAEEYSVEIPLGNRDWLRGGQNRGRGNDQLQAGGVLEEEDPARHLPGDRQEGGEQQQQQQRNQPELRARIVSTGSDSSAAESSVANANVDLSSTVLSVSTPNTSPSTSTFSANAKNPSAVTPREHTLCVAFDLPVDIAGTALVNNPLGPKIISIGTYLSTFHLERITLSGPLAEATAHAGDDPLFHRAAGTKYATHAAKRTLTMSETGPPVHDLIVDGYLGIGATSTVFTATARIATDSNVASSPSSRLARVALKYYAPELYPASARDSKWDTASVREAIVRENRAYERIQSAAAAVGFAGPLAPAWFGMWEGACTALGSVWCGIMEAGEVVGDMTAEEKQSVLAQYRRLHALGIVHDDVSRSNLCRLRGSIVLIDFGKARFGPGPRADPSSLLAASGQDDTVFGGDGDAGGGDWDLGESSAGFGRWAEEEMRVVRGMLGV